MNEQHRAAPPSTRMARTQLAAAISAILAVGAQFHALPAFALLNARAGVGFGKVWRVDAFVPNHTNQEAATSVSTTPGAVHDRADYVSRPRTAGLELHYSFKDH